MRRSIRDKWVAALRSGLYPQTKGTLHRRTPKAEIKSVGYCCLGVLCIVMNFAEYDTGDGRSKFIDNHYNEMRDSLSFKAGAKVFNSDYAVTADLIARLIDLNDTQEADFNTIADFIEQNVPVDED